MKDDNVLGMLQDFGYSICIYFAQFNGLFSFEFDAHEFCYCLRGDVCSDQKVNSGNNSYRESSNIMTSRESECPFFVVF